MLKLSGMMAIEYVSHPGVVSEVTDKEIKVKIVSSGACGGCNIKSACNVADMAEKELVISVENGEEYSIGQPVSIRMSARQGNKAVLYAYLVPAVLLIFMILLFSVMGMKDLYVALAAITVVGIYYFVLYLFRNKIKKQFKYEVLTQGNKINQI